MPVAGSAVVVVAVVVVSVDGSPLVVGVVVAGAPSDATDVVEVADVSSVPPHDANTRTDMHTRIVKRFEATMRSTPCHGTTRRAIRDQRGACLLDR